MNGLRVEKQEVLVEKTVIENHGGDATLMDQKNRERLIRPLLFGLVHKGDQTTA
jgi:hypothetical protein